MDEGAKANTLHQTTNGQCVHFVFCHSANIQKSFGFLGDNPPVSQKNATFVRVYRIETMISYLQIDKLTKSFGDLVLFENITFGVAQGQKIGLIAKNGSGKTTLKKTTIPERWCFGRICG